MLKTIATGVAFVVLAYFSMLSAALACEIEFSQSPVVVGSDNKARVTVIVTWEHRKCVLAEDELNIDIAGVKIHQQSGWRKIRYGVYHNDLAIELTAKDKGAIRVWRECSKKGISEGLVDVIRMPKKAS